MSGECRQAGPGPDPASPDYVCCLAWVWEKSRLMLQTGQHYQYSTFLTIDFNSSLNSKQKIETDDKQEYQAN